MYEKLTKISQPTIDELKTLMSEVSLIDTGKRLGAGGTDNLSVYTYSKWKSWNRAQKNRFKQCFDQQAIETSVIGWFLHFPANTGFLDLMTYWVDKPMSGIVTAYALEDSQSIWLNGQEISLEKGEAIRFDLRVPHEIKATAAARNWACIMQLG